MFYMEHDPDVFHSSSSFLVFFVFRPGRALIRRELSHRSTVTKPYHLNNTAIAPYLGANKGVETDFGHDRD